MTKIDRREELADIDEDATEGQLADYLYAEASGDYGSWAVGIIEYVCEGCGYTLELLEDGLTSYNDLIQNWHLKAQAEGDFFSKFVFEYLSFIAHLKVNLFPQADSDRRAIQLLKANEQIKKKYMLLISKNTQLKKVWTAVIQELNESPLLNSSKDFDNPEVDKWWNSCGPNPNISDNQKIKGVVQDLSDWDNMIELWCGVRNNLFHGGKNPNMRRDQFLVEHCFKSLSHFMSIEIKNIK